MQNTILWYIRMKKDEITAKSKKMISLMAKILFRAPNSKLKRIKTILKAMKKAKKFNPEIEKIN